jgi:hypothetical protein
MTRPARWWLRLSWVVLAAGVVSGAGARVGCVVPGAGTPIRGCDLRRRGRGYDLCACRDECQGNVDVGKRLTLEGEGADVVTVRAMDFNNHKEIDK